MKTSSQADTVARGRGGRNTNNSRRAARSAPPVQGSPPSGSGNRRNRFNRGSRSLSRSHSPQTEPAKATGSRTQDTPGNLPPVASQLPQVPLLQEQPRVAENATYPSVSHQSSPEPAGKLPEMPQISLPHHTVVAGPVNPVPNTHGSFRPAQPRTDQPVQPLQLFSSADPWGRDNFHIIRGIAQEECESMAGHLRRYLKTPEFLDSVSAGLLGTDLEERLLDTLTPRLFRRLSEIFKNQGPSEHRYAHSRPIHSYPRSSSREEIDPVRSNHVAPYKNAPCPGLRPYESNQCATIPPQHSDACPSSNSRPNRIYRRNLGPTEPHLQEAKPLNDSFKKVLSYRLYRLANLDPGFDYDLAADVNERVKRIKNTLHCEMFTGKNSLAILQFLKNFSTACDETGTSEGVALHLFRHFLLPPARDMFMAYYQVGLEGSQPGRDSISSYPEAVQWLLLTYAQEGRLSERYRQLLSARQQDGETETEFGTRLRLETLELGDVFTEANLITTFIEGLQDHARYIVRNEFNANRSMSYTVAQERAQSLGDTHRGQQSAASLRQAQNSRTLLRNRSVSPPRSSKAISHALAINPGSNENLESRSDSSSSMQLIRNPRRDADARKSREESPMDSRRDYLVPAHDGRYRSGSPSADQTNMARLLCYVCFEKGHYTFECPNLTEEQRLKARRAYGFYHEKRRSRSPSPATNKIVRAGLPIGRQLSFTGSENSQRMEKIDLKGQRRG